jgi:hypothetical protein
MPLQERKTQSIWSTRYESAHRNTQFVPSWFPELWCIYTEMEPLHEEILIHICLGNNLIRI